MITPGERIEPKIIGLFKNIMSARIDDLKIDWGTDVTQAPGNPVIFPGDVVSILARMGKDNEVPGQVTMSAKIDSVDRKFTVKMKEILGEDMPIPVLWAREIIRDLEEGTTGLSDKGSKQAQRKEKGTKEKIIEVSKEFGLISRETSFIAIEKREDKDKTTGEVILRKVPVNLAKGWHGMELMNFESAYMAVAQPVAECMPMPHDEAWHFSLGDRPYLSNESSGKERSNENVAIAPPRHTAQDILLMILSLQQAAGGFRITRDVASILGIAFSDIKENAKIIEVEEKIDKFILLSTAVILTLLKKRFYHMKDSWSAVVQKSEKWLEREMERTKPHIKGMSLEKWVEDYVGKLDIDFSGE